MSTYGQIWLGVSAYASVPFLSAANFVAPIAPKALYITKLTSSFHTYLFPDAASMSFRGRASSACSIISCTVDVQTSLFTKLSVAPIAATSPIDIARAHVFLHSMKASVFVDTGMCKLQVTQLLALLELRTDVQ